MLDSLKLMMVSVIWGKFKVIDNFTLDFSNIPAIFKREKYGHKCWQYRNNYWFDLELKST